ncbi:MAG: hypothetical protein CFE23_13290 [Flavobacterium sp. BFFFF1]|uniref:hypothetical protein n=1 Tax=Flavobacterium sp. BFFFF1 TaxID=2015557 RepID=UPI000BD35EBF|nr:hypothetical protein [Flavobacterium sp. BFFFF1]OYU79559.1 MAG: hypothetical protein CFE23_13290 [Flavobacterium sp. BFFFF1]
MKKDDKDQLGPNPEKDPQLQRNKGTDDLDSDVNTDFKSKGYMKSETDQEDPATDPNTVPNKPGFKKNQE